MATNQQLKDYIVQQTNSGVSKDTVKSALVGAGWKEEDINQAIAEVQAEPQNMAPLKPILPIQPVQQNQISQSARQPQSQPLQQPQQSQPAKPAEVSQTSKPYGFSAAPEKTSPVSFVTSDIFQSKGETVFQPSSEKRPTSPDSSAVKPQMLSGVQKERFGGMSGKIFPISLGIVSVALLGGNIYFFLQNGDLRSQIDSLNSGKTSFEGQIASLAGDKKNLTDQVDSLNKTITELNNQLSIFAIPADGATTTIPFNAIGALGGGGKSLYSITTNKNIVLFVKNSKDAGVDAGLKPLLGAQVSLEGTHQAGSNQLTITTINGQSVQATQSAPQATSTTQ
ncbi:MAG: hypothetical protein AAB536_00440 [Patescibacteria group bacterium]